MGIFGLPNQNRRQSPGLWDCEALLSYTGVVQRRSGARVLTLSRGTNFGACKGFLTNFFWGGRSPFPFT